MGPTPQRPAPGFRLNAPQAESQAENGSGEFAGLGDEIEDGPFPSSNSGVYEDDKVDDKPELQEHRQSRSPRPSLTLEQHRQILVQQQVDAQLRQQLQQQIQMQHQQHVSQQQQRAVPYKFLIAIGIVIIFLLIGLITTVVVILGGDDSSSDKAVVTPGFSQPNTNPASNPSEFIPSSAPTISPTRAVVVGPTTAPKTTLGRVFQRGKLYCGVSDGQPGFSEVDSETGERLGIDAELVSQQCDCLRWIVRRISVCHMRSRYTLDSTVQSLTLSLASRYDSALVPCLGRRHFWGLHRTS
jgi:hypothetical protein